MIKNKILIIALIASALTTCTPRSGKIIEITNAWSRPSPSMSTAGAAYMVIENLGKEPDALLGAKTDICRVVELHESFMQDDVMKMRPVENGKIDLPPGESIELKPGGKHLMLIDLVKPLESGSTFELTLEFERVGVLSIDVEIE